tara:strand:- start:12563 stop:15319 length:2757 start_codon:yes stop_codon:yes gene_type:complete
MKANKLNKILALAVLCLTFLVYYNTMAETVSYWDCGEFIATSYILGVPHPPGSPLFLILGRIFSMLPIGEDIAFRVNLLSPIASAFSVMFLYLIIVQLVTLFRGKPLNRRDQLITYGSAIIGSLIFAFTDSHWFNAVEAEVYAMSTLTTAVVTWLILHWLEYSDSSGNERYILMISYILGLATGIHLLNLLALPFMGMIIYFKKTNFSWGSFSIMSATTGAIFIIIYLGIIKGFPQIAAKIGLTGLALVILFIFCFTIYAIVNKERLVSLILSSTILVIIGYSTYGILFIRSTQDPAIDENDPETVERAIKYLEREQYGSIFTLPRKYKKEQVGSYPHKISIVGRPGTNGTFSSSQKFKYMFHDLGTQLDFLWNYQIKRMYFRYFLWQFAGRGPAGETWVSDFGALQNRGEDGVDWSQFVFPLPFLLGIYGMVYHFKRDPERAWSIMALFFMTGLAIIFYLNQDKFQPRERDYSYVGSFFAYSIWIGIAISAFLDKLVKFSRKQKFRPFITVSGFALLLIIPGIMLSSNYHVHDRSGNYVAWDYSYNILQTCEPNGIIFTNGDNDTFPLWYLQEVEGIRKDVMVVNLSLLNTDWYIKQMRDARSGDYNLISFHNGQIEGKDPIGKNPTDGKPLFLRVDRWKDTPISIPVIGDSKNTEGKITWNLKPTLGAGGIRVQDLMVLHIIRESNWKFPIYFAVTVSPSNRLGLEKYLQMEGLAFRLRSHPVPSVNYEKLSENLMNVVDGNNWETDYSPGYMYRNLNNPDVYLNPNIRKLLQNYRSAFLQLSMDRFRKLNAKQQLNVNPIIDLDSLNIEALKPLNIMSELMPEDILPITSKEMTLQMGQIYHDAGDIERGKTIFRKFHNSTRPDIVGFLLNIYKQNGYIDESIDILENWTDTFPADTNAMALLKRYLSEVKSPDS